MTVPRPDIKHLCGHDTGGFRVLSGRHMPTRNPPVSWPQRSHVWFRRRRNHTWFRRRPHTVVSRYSYSNNLSWFLSPHTLSEMEGSDGTCEVTSDTVIVVQIEEAKCVIWKMSYVTKLSPVRVVNDMGPGCQDSLSWYGRQLSKVEDPEVPLLLSDKARAK